MFKDSLREEAVCGTCTNVYKWTLVSRNKCIGFSNSTFVYFVILGTTVYCVP